MKQQLSSWPYSSSLPSPLLTSLHSEHYDFAESLKVNTEAGRCFCESSGSESAVSRTMKGPCRHFQLLLSCGCNCLHANGRQTIVLNE
ncbi:hypothetical protein ABVT39_005452, partial [Epinephelus coioides]